VSYPHWRNGAPTEYGIEVYTEGDCWILAGRLHALFGFDIYSVDEDVHWVVRVGRNSYLDVEGLHTRAELAERWGCKRDDIRPAAAWMLRVIELDSNRSLETFTGGARRSTVMAKRLVEKYVS
jgi:hypothetical protein